METLSRKGRCAVSGRVGRYDGDAWFVSLALTGCRRSGDGASPECPKLLALAG